MKKLIATLAIVGGLFGGAAVIAPHASAVNTSVSKASTGDDQS